jgi:hypothetical protein
MVDLQTPRNWGEVAVWKVISYKENVHGTHVFGWIRTNKGD